MFTFWDTSAVVPLIFEEPNSKSAQLAYAQSARAYAWSWLRVEAEAALSRRGADTGHERELGKLLNVMEWIDLAAERYADLCGRNREWRLRAADAGHLFCCQQAAIVLPGLQFVCFDDEIVPRAIALGLTVWTS